MLTAEFKKEWVEALRSGEFPQGKNALKTQDGYCCLGVACVLKGLEFNEHPVVGLIPNRPDLAVYRLKDEVENFALPSEEMAIDEWGLESNLGRIPEENRPEAFRILKEKGFHIPDPYSLAYLNDNEVPFSVIADVIEECL